MKIGKASALGGLLGGILIYIWFLTVYLYNQNPFFGFWANLVIIWVGITVFTTQFLYRKMYVNQTFSFGHGVLIGGLTTVLSGLIGGMLIYISTQYFIPNAIEVYKNEALKHLIVNKKQLIKESSEAIYQTYLGSIPQITAFNSVQRHFTSNILIPGLMFSFLTAIALRKNAIGEK
jgi:Protein of unknown function (DUF4199)